MNLRELAARLGAEVHGDGDLIVTGARGLEDAGPGDISYLADEKHRDKGAATAAAAVIVANPELVPEAKAALIHPAPTLAFARVLRIFHPLPEPTEATHPTAVLADDLHRDRNVWIGPHVVIEGGASLGEGCRIEAGSYVGAGCVIGPGTTVRPHVTILEGSRIGARCLIHSGTVIGSDGFGFTFHEGMHHKIPQVGTVEIGDDCEIGANVCIDRATTGVTRIGNNVIIDNLVQVAHNVEVGDGSILVAQTGVSGSTRLGKFVTLAGQTGTIGHIEIGDMVVAAARAGIDRSIPAGSQVFGYPPVDYMSHHRRLAAIERLPDLLKRVRKLERRLRDLEDPS